MLIAITATGITASQIHHRLIQTINTLLGSTFTCEGPTASSNLTMDYFYTIMQAVILGINSIVIILCIMQIVVERLILDDIRVGRRRAASVTKLNKPRVRLLYVAVDIRRRLGPFNFGSTEFRSCFSVKC